MKSLAKQAIRGSVAMAAAQVLANAAAFIMAWSVARGMGDAAYGVFAAAYALATSIASLADSGVRMTLIREVARVHELWRKLWLYALIISLILALLVALGFAGFIAFSESLASQELRFWLLGYALLWTMMRISLGVPAGHNRLVSVAIWGALERVGGAILVSVLVFAEGVSLVSLAQWLCVFEFLVLVLLAFWILAQNWETQRDTSMTVVKFIKVALPFGISAAAFAVLGRMDLIVLGFAQPPDVTGHYAAAQLLAMTGIFAGITVAGALFPTLSQLGKAGDVQESRRLIQPAMGLLALVMIGFGVLVSIPAADILILMYGDAYAVAEPWLILFAMTAPFVAINSVAGSVIGAWGWQKRWAKTLWILLPIIVLSYWVAADYDGVRGVAWVNASTQLLFTVIAWYWMSRKGLVDVSWLFYLLGLMLVCGTLLWFLDPDVRWILLPFSLVAIFGLKICRLTWLATAIRLVR